MSGRHEPGTGSTGDGDNYFLALLYATDELGRVLTQFAQTNGFHTDDSGTCAIAVVLENSPESSPLGDRTDLSDTLERLRAVGPQT